MVPADVAVVLLVRAGLDEYRRAHRGEHRRTDEVLIAMTHAALRWKETTDPGQSRAPLPDTEPSSELLTTRQAADLARTSDRTIRRFIAAGRIPAARAGRAYLIRRDELDHYTRR